MSSPLRRSGFRRLWLAGLISDTGDWLLLVALPILVFQRTGSALGTSLAFLVELVPAVLVAPLAGRLADRCDRRRLLIVVSLLQAAGLMPLLLAGSALPVVYAVIGVQATLTAIFDPAKNALLPMLVEPDDLVPANALIGLNQNLGRLAGAGAGGVLLAVGALPAIVLADAVSFLLAVALLTGVPAGRPRTATAAATGSGRAWRNPAVRVTVVVLTLASLAQGVFVVLFVVFVARVLHGGAAENGLLRGVQAIGAIGGGLLLTRVRRLAPGRLAGLACVAFGLIAIVTWNLPRVSTAEVVYVVLFVAAGVPAVGIVTGLSSVVQQSTVDTERGSAFAAVGVAAALGQAAGMLGAGLLGDRLGTVPVLDLQAALYLCAGLVAMTRAGSAAMGHRAEPRRAEPRRAEVSAPRPAARQGR